MPDVETEADRQRFRAVMGHFATGVAVVTGMGSEGAVGMTTNALCSLSLEPLLVVACVDNTARTLPVVLQSRRFGVNVLQAGQDAVSGRFASKLPLDRKFEAVDYRLEHGVPVLNDALAWLVCEVRDTFPGGDHTIAVGRVAAMGHGEGRPLVWYRGSYTTVTPLEPG
jgi:flavin reductase (DIM6/NTAB) family NADH-FMN oxidoreductase RutF